MSEFYEPEAVLVADICRGSSDDLPELFAARTSRWPHPYMSGEGGTFGTFSDLEQAISPERAFSLIGVAVQLALHQTDSYLFTTALSLLAGLARASGTTEVPGDLEERWTDLRKVVASFPLEKERDVYWSSLLRWYRLA